MNRDPQPEGRLYVVATPIGNLKDMSFRAVEILKTVDLIACEDTRDSLKLLAEYGIQRPLKALFQGQEDKRSREVLKCLNEGQQVALISSAGTPNISDPGFRLVRGALADGVEVISVPGPTALVSALSISGLPTNAFLFEGFLPVKQGPRRKKMSAWRGESRTVIYYESPHRIVRSLEDLKSTLGNIPVVLARELTKKFEEVWRGSLEQALENFHVKGPLGEYVVLFNLKEKGTPLES